MAPPSGNKPPKLRLDLILVQRGLFESRERAQSEILAGNILVNETPAAKPGHQFPGDCEIRVKERFPYVGRGALKLLAAFDRFGLEVHGKTAIDLGASTGGFTEVLLEKGASRVYAVDVGTNQLAWKLRSDPRVVSMEKTHAADLPNCTFEPAPGFAAVDVSFISLTKVLTPLQEVLTGDYSIVILIKPQFELWKELIKDGGIAPKEHHPAAIRNVLDFAESIGLSAGEVIESPITGAKSGNIEYLAVLRRK